MRTTDWILKYAPDSPIEAQSAPSNLGISTKSTAPLAHDKPVTQGQSSGISLIPFPVPAMPTVPTLVSSPCTQARLESEDFLTWRAKLGNFRPRYHRKDWEFYTICQALHERGMLQTGKRGLAFAVGSEPLPSLFAGLGCTVVATDMDSEGATKAGWVETKQHCHEVDALFQPRLCDKEDFYKRVSFRTVDMRAIPDDLRDFDFIWSSCSMEHLGSLEMGERFVYESMKCLRPGGIAVHTTEYNVQSNQATVETGPVVLFRKRDIETMAGQLRAQGHRIDMDFTLGNGNADLFIQKPKYRPDIHLRIQFQEYVATSFAIIIQKSDT